MHSGTFLITWDKTRAVWPQKCCGQRGRSLQPKKISVPKMKHGGGRCIWNRDTRQGGRNHDKRRICKCSGRIPQVVSSKTVSGLCLPTWQWPKTYFALSEELHPQDQSEHYWLDSTKPWLQPPWKSVRLTENQGPCLSAWESHQRRMGWNLSGCYCSSSSNTTNNYTFYL